MTKSEKHIEKDLYRQVKDSALAAMVTGTVYRGGMRPDSSVNEDIVVRFLAGTEGQIQTGVVLLHVYVQDIASKAVPNRKIENIARVEAIEDAVIAFVSGTSDVEYLYELDGSPQSSAVEGKAEHVIFARIRYQRIIE